MQRLYSRCRTKITIWWARKIELLWSSQERIIYYIRRENS